MRKRQALIGVVSFLLVLYLWSYRGTSHSPDEWFFIDSMNQALSLGFHRLPSGQLQYLGLYALGLPLIAISQLVENFGTYQILLLLNIFATAIAGGAIVLLLLEMDYGPEIAAVVALVYGAGTLAWPYSGYLLREPLAAMGLSLAAFMLVRYNKKGGLGRFLGWLLIFIWASLTKRTASFLAFPFSLYLTWTLYTRREPSFFWSTWSALDRKLKILLGSCITALIAGLFYLLVQHYVPFPKNFAEMFPDLHNLTALLISPGWGLFVFCPVLLLTIPGLPGFLRRDSGNGLFLASLGLLYLVASTRAYFWWGFWGWGPRQLNSVLPFLCLPLAETLRKFGNKWTFRLAFGSLFSLSAMLACMQTLVAYPFYEKVFKAGIALPEYTWDLKVSPLLNHWRFLSINEAEVAWASKAGIRWSLFVPLTGLLAMAFFSAIYANKNQRLKANLTIIIVILSFLLSIYTLSFSYRDEDFGGSSGFVEAFSLLRKEHSAGDKLIIYMWGEPPWAYLPRVAMLNYCKGLCPPHIVIIKEQFIDENPRWEKTLKQLLGDAENIWVVMQGLAETSPERPVEFALAKYLYFAESIWTGPSVRVVRFKKGVDNLIASGELEDEFGLISYRLKARQSTLKPGEFLYVELSWRLPLAVPEGCKISLQLLDERGQLVSQMDYPVTFLIEPSTAKGQGIFVERYALKMPKSSGEYDLILVVYSDRGRFSFKDGADHAKLARVKVP